MSALSCANLCCTLRTAGTTSIALVATSSVVMGGPWAATPSGAGEEPSCGSAPVCDTHTHTHTDAHTRVHTHTGKLIRHWTEGQAELGCRCVRVCVRVCVCVCVCSGPADGLLALGMCMYSTLQSTRVTSRGAVKPAGTRIHTWTVLARSVRMLQSRVHNVRWSANVYQADKAISCLPRSTVIMAFSTDVTRRDTCLSLRMSVVGMRWLRAWCA